MRCARMPARYSARAVIDYAMMPTMLLQHARHTRMRAALPMRVHRVLMP